METSLYLGHPWGLKEIVYQWEQKIENELNLNLINPFYDLHPEITAKVERGELGRYGANYINIVEEDVGAIKKTMGGIYIIEDHLKLQQPQIGTFMEIVYAFHNRKLAYVLALNGHQDHFWLKYHATRLFVSWNELENFLKNKFGRRLLKN